jgi:hypothetical protein
MGPNSVRQEAADVAEKLARLRIKITHAPASDGIRLVVIAYSSDTMKARRLNSLMFQSMVLYRARG